MSTICATSSGCSHAHEKNGSAATAAPRIHPAATIAIASRRVSCGGTHFSPRFRAAARSARCPGVRRPRYSSPAPASSDVASPGAEGLGHRLLVGAVRPEAHQLGHGGHGHAAAEDHSSRPRLRTIRRNFMNAGRYLSAAGKPRSNRRDPTFCPRWSPRGAGSPVQPGACAACSPAAREPGCPGTGLRVSPAFEVGCAAFGRITSRVVGGRCETRRTSRGDQAGTRRGRTRNALDCPPGRCRRRRRSTA